MSINLDIQYLYNHSNFHFHIVMNFNSTGSESQYQNYLTQSTGTLYSPISSRTQDNYSKFYKIDDYSSRKNDILTTPTKYKEIDQMIMDIESRMHDVGDESDHKIMKEDYRLQGNPGSKLQVSKQSGLAIQKIDYDKQFVYEKEVIIYNSTSQGKEFISTQRTITNNVEQIQKKRQEILNSKAWPSINPC